MSHTTVVHPTERVSLRRTLLRAQAISGLLFALFLALHLLSFAAAILGPAQCNAALELFGAVYKQPLVEIALLASLAVHVVAGLWRWRAFSRHETSNQPTTRVHRISGRVLSFVVVGHVLATRGPAWFAELHIDSSYVSFSLEQLGWYFYPYYTALFAFGAFHMLRGVQVAGGALHLRRLAGRMGAGTWRPIVLASAAVAVLALLSLGGVLHELDRSAYAAYAEFFARLLG